MGLLHAARQWGVMLKNSPLKIAPTPHYFECVKSVPNPLPEATPMGMDNFSSHQQKIIKRYYTNLDTIQLQKLAETVTDLYLAEGKKIEKLWKTAVAAMVKLEVPQQRIDILVKSQNLEQLAKLVKELQT